MNMMMMQIMMKLQNWHKKRYFGRKGKQVYQKDILLLNYHLGFLMDLVMIQLFVIKEKIKKKTLRQSKDLKNHMMLM